MDMYSYHDRSNLLHHEEMTLMSSQLYCLGFLYPSGVFQMRWYYALSKRKIDKNCLIPHFGAEAALSKTN